MYTKHFNLIRRPFSRVPTANGCVMFPGIQSCFERARDAIQECAGPVLVVGPSGCSKSTLLSLLEKEFAGSLSTVNLNCATIDSRHELIQCLLFEMGLPFQSDNVGDLRLKLIDHLKSPEQCPEGLLLLVDEAHNLPLEVLEELRMITNMVCGSRHQIRLVVAGTRPLEEKLAHPQLESFAQRIGARCYLQPMSRTETMFFVLAQIQMSGRDGRDIFQPSALEKIFDITDGVPRLVTHLADHSLKMAAQQKLFTVESRLVNNAWHDLQQLPTTAEFQNFTADSTSGNIIEIGSLDEAAPCSDAPVNQGSSTCEEDSGPQVMPFETDELKLVSEDSDFENYGQTDSAKQEADNGIPTPHVSMDSQDGIVSNPAQPVEKTLDSLMSELQSIDDDHSVSTNAGVLNINTENDSTGPADIQPTDAENGSPVDNSAAVVSPDDLASALDAASEMSDEEHQRKQAERRKNTESAKSSALPPTPTVQLPLTDPTSTQPFPFPMDDSERAPFGSDEASEAPVADSGVSDMSMTQALPTASEIAAASMNEQVGTNQPSENSDSPFQSTSEFVGATEREQPPAPAPTSEELFGSSFQEEPVVDVQSSILADQNRISSGMTSPEISDLTPEADSVSQSSPAIVPEDVEQGRDPLTTQSFDSVAEREETPPAPWPPQPEPVASTDSVQAPEDAGPTEDDSDMLIVDHAAAPTVNPEPDEEAGASSTGQVIRMNYKDLFQQLRSQDPNSQT